jgi:hypothetical protein
MRMLLLGGGGAIVVVAVVVVLAAVLGGGSSDEKLSIGGCVAETIAEQGREHAAEPPEGYEYDSFPPTSGTHSPSPAIYNFYTDPVDQFLLIHNLEHGAVVVQYGDEVPEETVAEIRAWYESDSEGQAGLIVAPLPELGSEVALTAWTHVLTCQGFNEEAFDAFTNEFRFEGPERFSPDAMLPGSQ